MIDEFYGRNIKLNGYKNNTKFKEAKAKQDIVKLNVEKLRHSRAYYENMRILHQNESWLTHDGVAIHVKRQQSAQKAKEEVKKMLETGFHKNVKRAKRLPRVTIPK